MIFLELFFNFFIIGLFTIGGGYAMLPLIQHIVVGEKAWISESVFADIVTISQMTPGPIGINSATFIGYSVVKEAGYCDFLCICGSVTTTLAVVLPSFLIVLGLCHAMSKFNTSPVFKGVMSWLRPTVAGLIGAAAVIMITPENFPDWKSWVLFAASFGAGMFTKIHPILILVLAGAAGYFLY